VIGCSAIITVTLPITSIPTGDRQHSPDDREAADRVFGLAMRLLGATAG
jgi:hypothetical protein